MDLLWFYRYKRGGGQGDFVDWEFLAELSSWDEAPAPGQIGKRVLEAVFQRQIPGDRAALVSNVMHWSYGLFWGAQYGIVAVALPAPGWLRSGIAFGSIVLSSGSMVNVGTVRRRPPAGRMLVVGQARRLLMASDGAEPA